MDIYPMDVYPMIRALTYILMGVGLAALPLVLFPPQGERKESMSESSPVYVNGARVLIRQQVTEDETEGGIVLPQSTKTKLPMGTVVKSGQSEDEEWFTPGTLVLFNPVAAIPIEWEGEEFVIVEFDDILLFQNPKKNEEGK